MTAPELPDYRERLGGAIHETSGFTAPALYDRLGFIFPGGFTTPQRVGHVMMAFVQSGTRVEPHPVLPAFEYEKGEPLYTEFPQHSTIADEIMRCGVTDDRLALLAHGYIWQQRSSMLKPYVMALLSYDSDSRQRVDDLIPMTDSTGQLHDHDVFMAYSGESYDTHTYRIRAGEARLMDPAIMPAEISLDLQDIARRVRTGEV